jgi:biopolymer transport protein ExbB/TolQ
MNNIEDIIFNIAEALRGPVLVLALLALAVTLIELGAFLVELARRRRRDYGRLESASVEARAALERGDETSAKAALRPVAWSTGMARSLAFMLDQWGLPGATDRMAKGLADFDFRSLKRLERTRLLVRAGPALGLMGTLIPLSPALEGLAKGDTEELSDNLRVAFSVTVLGLLIGAVAFAISLVRDRLYGQDLSDLEFVAATLSPGGDLGSTTGGRPGGARPATPPPPPPPAAAPAANKPPPPKDAKPLSSVLPPPGGAAGRPSPAGAPSPPPPPGAPAPAAASGGPSPSGAPAIDGPSSMGGGGLTPSSGASIEPSPSATGGGDAAEPPAHVPPLTPFESESGGQPPAAPPSPPPLPGPPIPEAPTESLPKNPPGDRPTHAQNHPPDGHNAPTRAPENQ